MSKPTQDEITQQITYAADWIEEDKAEPFHRQPARGFWAAVFLGIAIGGAVSAVAVGMGWL